jgi:thiol-disulfide isomerase/thioredoxin
MHSPTEQSSPAISTPPVTEPKPVHGLGRQAKLAVGVLLACALAALFWPRGDGSFKEPGGFLYDIDGKAMTLGPRLAPVSLVHFWATWCPPCIQEIPALQRLNRDFRDHPDFSLVMVAVSDENTKVRSFMGDWADMMLFDPNWDVANRYGTDKLPETYLVIRGEVVKKFVGMQDWDDPALRELLTSHLKNAGGTAAAPAAGGS